MSHTPEDQLLDIPITEARKALKVLVKTMENRIEASEEWKKEHLKELGFFIMGIQSLSTKLLFLQKENR